MAGMRPIEMANLPQYILNTIKEYKGDAQIDSETRETLTYESIWRDTHQIGNWLTAQKLGSGSIIAICMPNCLDYVKILLGSLQSGATVSLISPGATPRELEHTVTLVKPNAIFAPVLAEDRLQVLTKLSIKVLEYKIGEISQICESMDFREEVCPSKPEDIAMLLSSSGSTGLPKAVAIKHSNLLWALAELKDHLCLKQATALGLLPYYHAYGLGLLLITLVQGDTLVLQNKYNLNRMLEIIDEFKLEQIHIVPSLMIKLTSDTVPRDTLKNLRLVCTGAGHVPPKLQYEFYKKLSNGSKLYHGYGMTETTHFICTGAVNLDRPGSSGRMLPCMSAKIVDRNGDEVETGIQGELWLKGPMVTAGYHNKKLETLETYLEDGWLKTGDIAYIDNDGYLFIVDRIKELIKFQGFQISATELEHVIVEQKGVLEAAVIGVPHPLYGEVPKAYIVADENHVPTEDAIKEAVQSTLSHYKWLRGGVEFVDSLPKTQSLKINRRQLRLNALG